MAERWQQWMPFHIDRWRGSAHVQAMRAAARAGYLYLLASAWQSEDGSLPDEDEELQVLAGLTEEEWAQQGGRILRRFTRRADGRYVNEVLLAEWIAAKAVYDQRAKQFDEVRRSRSVAGKMGADKRWGGKAGGGSEDDREVPAGVSQVDAEAVAGVARPAGTNDFGPIAAVSRKVAAAVDAIAREHVCHSRAMTSEGLQGQEQQQEQERVEGLAAHEQEPAQIRCENDHERDRRETRRRALRVPQPVPQPADAREPVFLRVPLWGGARHDVSEAEVVGYEQAYAGVDVRGELRRMLPWLDANPDKRSRTLLGSKRRIVGWLGRAQDRVENQARGRSESHGSHQHSGYGMEQRRLNGKGPGERSGGSSRSTTGGKSRSSFGVPSRGQQRVEQALEELARAGVCLEVERPEAGAGEVWPAAGRGDGCDAAGVVLPSYC